MKTINKENDQNLAASHATKNKSKINDKINLIKIPAGQLTYFDFDAKSDPWMKELLYEMNEMATDRNPDDYFQETKLHFSGEMIKKEKIDIGEALIVKGTLTACYATECVKTLQPMKVDMQLTLNTVFLDQSFSTMEEFSEIDETYIDDGLYEIYYYQKRIVDLKEMLHEQIYLHYEQYPTLEDSERSAPEDSQQ